MDIVLKEPLPDIKASVQFSIRILYPIVLRTFLDANLRLKHFTILQNNIDPLGTSNFDSITFAYSRKLQQGVKDFLLTYQAKVSKHNA